jgi:hypothetical protein
MDVAAFPANVRGLAPADSPPLRTTFFFLVRGRERSTSVKYRRPS